MDFSILSTLILLSFILFLFGVYLAVKGYLKIQNRHIISEEKKEKTSKVDFMVDTFHELVQELKEKEKELIRLKAIAEERAHKSEEYNEHVLQSVPSGVISLDNNMKITSINQAAEKILNLGVNEVLNKGYQDVIGEPLVTFLEKKEFVARGEYQYKTHTGRLIWLGLTTSPLKNTTGSVMGMVVVFTDLTEIKELQNKIELKERLAHLGEISAGIAHELRNPMGVIAGYAKLLQKKIKKEHTPTVHAILKEIEQMDRIISEFLAFSKPANLNLSRLNIKSLLEEVIQEVNKKENIRFKMTSDEHIFVQGDDILLKQAFKNLFLNAFDAMPDGGEIKISLKSIDKRKREILVSDNGIGISDDIKEKIFLPFFTTKNSGTGLGLSLVQKIIVSHGGSISVDNKKKGTIFRIVLPI